MGRENTPFSHLAGRKAVHVALAAVAAYLLLPWAWPLISSTAVVSVPVLLFLVVGVCAAAATASAVIYSAPLRSDCSPSQAMHFIAPDAQITAEEKHAPGGL